MNYPDLMAMASRFIDTLTCGILEKYSIIAEAFSSQSVSPVSHRQSLSFIITKAEVRVKTRARELPFKHVKLNAFSANRTNS